MNDDQLNRFVEMASAPCTVTVLIDGVETELEVVEGRLDGGWIHYGGAGEVVEHGVFWKDPGGVLESITERF